MQFQPLLILSVNCESSIASLHLQKLNISGEKGISFIALAVMAVNHIITYLFFARNTLNYCISQFKKSNKWIRMETVHTSLLLGLLLSTQTLIGYPVLSFRFRGSRFEPASQKSVFGRVAVQGPETSLRGSRNGLCEHADQFLSGGRRK